MGQRQEREVRERDGGREGEEAREGEGEEEEKEEEEEKDKEEEEEEEGGLSHHILSMGRFEELPLTWHPVLKKIQIFFNYYFCL